MARPNGVGNFRIVLRRCHQYAVLLAMAVWLLVAICTFLVFIIGHGLGSWLAFGTVLFSATTGALVILPPFLLSQTLIGGLLTWSGRRITIQSCSMMLVGTATAAFIAWTAFRFLLKVPAIEFFSLAPLGAIQMVFHIRFGGSWFLLTLGAQGLLAALSWWHLRREGLLSG